MLVCFFPPSSSELRCPVLPCNCSQDLVAFLASSVRWGAGVEGVVPGTSKLKKKILVSSSRAGGLTLLPGVPRAGEGWD